MFLLFSKLFLEVAIYLRRERKSYRSVDFWNVIWNADISIDRFNLKDKIVLNLNLKPIVLNFCIIILIFLALFLFLVFIFFFYHLFVSSRQSSVILLFMLSRQSSRSSAIHSTSSLQRVQTTDQAAISNHFQFQHPSHRGP